MIPKKNRLSRTDIVDVKSFGKALHSQLATYIVHNKDHKTTKIGVVISKKILKSAVERNKLKRRIFTLCRNALMHSAKLHILIFPKKTAILNKTTNKAMEKEIEQLW